MFRVSYKPASGNNTLLGASQNIRGKESTLLNKRTSVLGTGFG